ncbi:cytochrome P450 [Cyathus striatus]|nr:cytochrome P450 [Cyathus striatus]
MSFDSGSALAIACFSVISILCFFKYAYTRLRFPPGPPSLPIVGHLGILPETNQETVFHEWSKLYGDIIHLHIPGRSFIILGSLKSASELLEKRSAIYSDRMRLVAFEIMGWTPSVVFMPYGKQFHKHRRLLQGELNKNICLSYYPIQRTEMEKLLTSLMHNPEQYEDHFFRFTASIIVKITYGLDLEENDPYIEISKKAMESINTCGPPGGTAVDFIPFLKYFPSWFPGTYYAFLARSFYKKRWHGPAIIRGVAAIMYSGAVETTQSMLLYLIFTLLRHPEVQKKVQEELDRVIGRQRFPTPEDRDLYLTLKQCNTPIPLGIPHRSLEDDMYNGMFIPKGSVVIANLYGIHHDEAVYKEPHRFDPDRYLNLEGAEPHPTAQFGFGRRRVRVYCSYE